ncbi:50S ribosomal protein L17 [bacterium]|nr:50S ribosomal protein L17 [bacterium]
MGKNHQSNIKNQARRVRITRNQLTDLIIHEQLILTSARAKEVSRQMDRLVTLGKKNTLSSRREAARILRNVKASETETALQKLFNMSQKKYLDRNGGYTKVLKLDNRKGDGAPVSIVMFV